VTTPPETAPEAHPDTGLDQRVSTLETGQQSILSKLDQLLTGPPEPAEAEQPAVSISEEIRKQLDQRDRRRAKAEPETPAPAAPEPEKPPVPPVRRIHKIMGWADA
jgi:hypothetical protein